jgi:hypothetical protein
MQIIKAISYKHAWEELTVNNQPELADILAALPDFLQEYLSTRKSDYRLFSRELWVESLSCKGWQYSGVFFSDNDIRMDIKIVGPVKNKISAAISANPAILNKWLFQQSLLAFRYNIIKLPVLLVPMKEFARKHSDSFYSRFTFEMCQTLLDPLSPMSLPYPFLILGYSEQLDVCDVEVIEIKSHTLAKNENIIFDKYIEFPPEYYLAGVNILTFFGTYLKEQYPNEEAKVRIEQDNTVVRLIIETKNGKSKVIEKALEEYQLIISGQMTPESITQNNKLNFDFHNELRIAQFRIESQRDIMQFQNNKIDKLLDILTIALTTKPAISLDFHPNLSLSNNIILNHEISSAIANLNELKDLIPKDDNNQIYIYDLEGSLATIEKEQNPEVVKKSPAMRKFKRLIDIISDEKSDLSKTIKAAKIGWEIFKDLTGKYNSIAQWCGLPQIPTIFTK